MSEIDNKWTERKTKKLLSDSDSSKLYSLCHTRAYEYYKRQHQWTTMIIAYLGAITTILEGTNLLLDEPILGISVAVLICAALSGVLGQRINIKDPSASAAAHQDMSKGYNRIILKIESELVNEPNEREPGTEFLKSITKSLIDLTTGGKIIPTFIWNKVQQDVGDGKIDPQKYWGQGEELDDLRQTLANEQEQFDSSIADHIVDASGNVMALQQMSPQHTVIDVSDPPDISNPNHSLPSVEIRLNPSSTKAKKIKNQLNLNRFG